MKGAEILSQTLEGLGVKHIFGIPGDVPHALAAFRKSRMDFIAVRHEQAAGFMADAYGRFSDLPGVMYASLGPGATNAITAVASSFQDRSPMIVLLDQVASGDFHPDYHQYLPLEKLFEPITKKTILIRRAGDVDFNVRYAFELAKNERPGPVALIFPEDVLAQDVSDEYFRGRISRLKLKSQPAVNHQQIVQIERAVRNSRFGVIIAGPGLIRARAETEFIQFAERFNFPVFTTFMAKGALSELHPLSLGAISRHFESVFEPLFEAADLVITVGYDYIEGIKPSFWEKGMTAKVVCIDGAENSVPEFYYPDIEVVADIKSILKELIGIDAPRQEVKFDLNEFRRAKDTSFRQQSSENRHICSYIDILSANLGGDDVLISDVGLHKQFVGLTYLAKKPQSVIFSNGLSAMGFSLPAAIAVKLLRPEKTVVTVCGDGGLMMNIQDLETCRRLNLPIIIVLFNDNCYGLIRWRQEKFFGGNIAVCLSNPDFPLLARSFGFNAEEARTTDEFIRVFLKAKNSGQPTLIHVPIRYNYSSQ